MKAIVTYVGDTVGYIDPHDETQEIKRDEKKAISWTGPSGIKIEFPKDEPVLIDSDEGKDSAQKKFLHNLIERAAVNRFFKVEVDATS